ncbi:hypothetical protein [Amycolatopsis vastitatis]|uniref:hypothetical protein n=1 Tax=Amycolatopsis vastitatis TaxID=1905142 RepID=UPI0011775A8D|nr:hypothetical protein [Amycolatopsis vastitatis]
MTPPGPVPTRTLLDRTGRLWSWHPTLPRRPGEEPGVFCRRGQRRTERELENEAEPIIEVRAPRLLTVKLVPVPAKQIRLNDLVVLPGRGELSPVIGIWPYADRYACLLYVCTDNGDWVHRRADSPLLRADLRSLGSSVGRSARQDGLC